MPMDRRLYPPNWEKVSLTIRRIAGWRCEWCGAAKGDPLRSGRPGKVILTVAHLGTPWADGRPGSKHDKHDIRRENLACLCAGCHLMYDLEDHIQHRIENRRARLRALARAAGQLKLMEEAIS